MRQLLIPSAALVPPELQLDLGQIPTGMIPLRGKPMIERIHQRYREQSNIETYVSCARAADQIQQYQQRMETDWTTCSVPADLSLGASVGAALDQLPDHRTTINFADTLVQPPTEPDTILYAEPAETLRWTSFTSHDGQITELADTYDEAPDHEKVFVGAFDLDDPERFRQLLADHSFYSALQQYSRQRSLRFREAEDWIDTGHLDTFHQAKKEYLNVRGFNDIRFLDNGVIEKRSEDSETLRTEMAWYQELPEQLQPYTPRIYSHDPDIPAVRMEYVGYPSLRELFIYGAHGDHIWNRIYSELFDLLDRFTGPAEIDEQALEQMYIEKTRRRLEQASQQPGLRPFFEDDTIHINGAEHPSASTILDQLEGQIQATSLLDDPVTGYLHGDLHFSNILFDVRHGIIKLIDPRGSFGDHTVHGDQRYDLAKLVHSVHGDYDFIINDLFNTTNEDGGFQYSIHTDDKHQRREQRFMERLGRQYPQHRDEILQIEALLFLSMVPLHSDHPQRQQVMLAQGIEKFSEQFQL